MFTNFAEWIFLILTGHDVVIKNYMATVWLILLVCGFVVCFVVMGWITISDFKKKFEGSI